jgi:hypothetical protein
MRYPRLTAARPLARIILAALLGGLLFTSAAHVRAQTGGMTITYPAGYNLVAFPPNTDISSIVNPLYTMQPGDTDYETIQPGQGTTSGFGYWAYFPTSGQITLDAGNDNLYSVLAPANQYVMVGNPSGIDSAVVNGATVVYTYDPTNGYTQSALLQPGQGAWALSTSGGPITVQASPAASPPPPAGSRPPAGRFYGAVTLHGQPAPGGTTVVANSTSGATCGQTTVGAAPATGSNYALDINGSDASCTTSGSALTFTVGGSSASPSAAATVPDVSGAIHIDLTAP